MGQILGKPGVGDKAQESEKAPAYPDYMLDPDAVAKDKVTWRHGGPPDYTVTRQMWAKERRSNHKAESLETLVENLVKNWEVEASHKMDISEWRTVDPEKYTFAINGGPPQDAQHMLKVCVNTLPPFTNIACATLRIRDSLLARAGFYLFSDLDIIADDKRDISVDFDESHRTFRNMMPNFAWEVLEVYSGPPTVAFKWRHWGWMKGDYVGKNEEGLTVTIKSHGAVLDIQGVTVAKLNDKLQVSSLETWFDPMDMFNQMRPTKETMTTTHMECPLGYKANLQKMGE